MNDFCIIGAGRLGLSMIEYISEKGGQEYVIAHSPESEFRAAKYVSDELIFRTVDRLFCIPKIFVITVGDSHISEISHQIAGVFGKNLAGRIVVHCSGSSGSELLSECRKAGAVTVAAHPYQTFSKPDGRLFANVGWGIESADAEGMEKGREFAGFFGGTASVIPTEKRVFYHLSAVAASNYLSSAAYLGKLFAREAGINFSGFSDTIMRQSVKNALDSPNFPITGPIARLDMDTVRKHLSAMKGREELVLPYCYMGLATLELVKFDRKFEDDSMAKMRLLLMGAISECKGGKKR